MQPRAVPIIRSGACRRRELVPWLRGARAAQQRGAHGLQDPGAGHGLRHGDPRHGAPGGRRARHLRDRLGDLRAHLDRRRGGRDELPRQGDQPRRVAHRELHAAPQHRRGDRGGGPHGPGRGRRRAHRLHGGDARRGRGDPARDRPEGPEHDPGGRVRRARQGRLRDLHPAHRVLHVRRRRRLDALAAAPTSSTSCGSSSRSRPASASSTSSSSTRSSRACGSA